jgi:DMSO/TMAO reductase YedYZ molybdopterin-dependent catalytic subunit
MHDDLRNESAYDATRNEQLLHSLERQHGLSRRQLLKLGAASLPILAGVSRLASPRAARAASLVNGSPIDKPLPPEWFNILGTNAEMRWDAVPGLGYTIPNERFFVRDHTLTPTGIDPMSYRLNVFGTGLNGSPTTSNPVQFTYQDLLRMPDHTVTSFVECAGNGRSYYGTQQGTPAGGSQWHLGGIGVAQWRGVRLSDVLERAGVQSGAVDVMPYGLDPTFVSGGVDSGHVRRPMSVAKAMDGDTLLAYEMNGQTLPTDHGFPIRAIVPTWVGIANIKWVGQIEVSSTPLFSLWNTAQYRMMGPSYPPDSPPLTNQAIKSAFELAVGANFPVGVRQELTGRSWSGTGSGIHQVEISTDGGASWDKAQVTGPKPDEAWAQWKFKWTPKAPGSYTLMARATDKQGTTQPDTVPFNTGGYLFWAVVKHPVTVS